MNDPAIVDAAEELGQVWMDTVGAKAKALPAHRQAVAMALAGASVAASCLFACNPDRAAVLRVVDAIVKAVLDDIEGGEG